VQQEQWQQQAGGGGGRLTGRGVEGKRGRTLTWEDSQEEEEVGQVSRGQQEWRRWHVLGGGWRVGSR
jgi:hypothetical protein